MKKNVFFILKLVLVLGLFGGLIYHVNFSNLVESFRNLRFQPFFIGLVFFICATFFDILRLYILLRIYELSFRFVFRLYFVGLFFSNFLFSNVGGDAYRVFALRQKYDEWMKPIVLISFDRLMGLGILVTAGCLIVLMDFNRIVDLARQHQLSLQVNIHPVWLLVCAGLGILIGGYFFLFKKSWFDRFLRLGWEKYDSFRHIIAGIPFTRLSSAFFVAVLFNIARLLRFYFFIRAFGADIHLLDLVVVLSLTTLVSMLPVTLGSLGIREGTITVSLAMFGVALPQGLAVALLNRVVVWVVSALGGIFFIQEGLSLRSIQARIETVHDPV
ncbi:MAG: UPF0104 family protein [Gemmatimonadetes bacterium]|nr:MAG: UPF0104 family protein [Gemmatimonadota bacterium]